MQELLHLNKPLFIAYVLKEELRRLWRCESRREAMRLFFDSLRKVFNSGVQKLVEFALKMKRHARIILSYFRYSISTAMVEGFNNKIKVVKKENLWIQGYRVLQAKNL